MKKSSGGQLRLGEGELELLQVMWQHGPVSISEAQSALPRQQGYTTVQTRLERLVAKRVASKSRTRPAKYSAQVTGDQVSRRDLSTLMNRVTGGKVVPLIAHLVNERPLTEAEISEIREMLEQAEGRMREDDE